MAANAAHGGLMLCRLLCILLGLATLTNLAWAQDLVVNGGFEEPLEGPATTIAGWRRWQGKPDLAYRVTDQVASGKWALFIKAVLGRGTPVVQQKLADYQPDQLYEVVFQARSARPYEGFRMDVLDRHEDVQTLAGMGYSHPEWQQHAVRFTAPQETGHPVYLRFYPAGPSMMTTNAVYIDEVRVLAMSETARQFTDTYAQVENDTFNAIVKLEFDLGTELDVVRWLLEDLAEYRVVASAKVKPLQERGRDLSDRIDTRLSQVKSFREERLFPGVVLSALPDAEIAEKSNQLEALVTELDEAIEEVRAEFQPQIGVLADQVQTLAPDWQPPPQATAQYSPQMLKDRFHRIISYHHVIPAGPYLARALWELQPTALQAYPTYDRDNANRPRLVEHNKPRMIPYIEANMEYTWFDWPQTKESFDSIFDEVRDNPAFSGIELEEPLIIDKHVCTPEGYAEFRKWLASRHDKEVGGFPLDEALNWEQPEKIESDFDLVVWMEFQQFKTYWMARTLKAMQDYVYSKDPNAVCLASIPPWLAFEPQATSYVTVPAALDWIIVPTFMNASVSEALVLDLARSNSKGPILEAVGTCYDRTIGRFAKDMSISFAHAGGLFNWCWVYISKYRAPAGITTGRWPPEYRGRWKEGRYDTARDIMGKMATIERYLIHTETAANVGLVYSERTGIYCSLPNTPNYYVNNLGIYQALQQLHIPCDALFTEGMTPQKLSSFKTLILIDAALLIDEELALLKDWCQQGGSLIIMGGAATRDQWGRPRDDFAGRRELLGVARSEAKSGAQSWALAEGCEAKLDPGWQYETVEPLDEAVQVLGQFDNGDIAALAHPYGQGQVYLLTAYNLGFSFDGSTYYKGMYKHYWPGFKDNLRKIVLQALREAKARLPVRAQDAPENVEVGLRKQGDRLIVHLLNYDDEGPVTGMALIVRGRGRQRAFYPADGQEIDTQTRGRDLHISVRDFEHHCCLVIEPR